MWVFSHHSLSHGITLPFYLLIQLRGKIGSAWFDAVDLPGDINVRQLSCKSETAQQV